MSDRLTTAALPQADQRYLADRFREAGVVSVQDLPPSAQAYLAWAVWDSFQRPLVWVTDGQRALEVLYQDLLTLTQGHDLGVVFFPPRETSPAPGARPDPDLLGERLRTLQACRGEPFPAVIVTSVQALLQKTLSPSAFLRSSERLGVSQDHDLEKLARKLEHGGYRFGVEVQEKGQAALRGGLLDVWPPSEPYPLRLEFFGSVLESIRSFDPLDQRSIQRLNEAMLPPADENGAAPDRLAATSDFLAHVPAHACWVWSNPQSIRHHAELYREGLAGDPLRSRTLTYRTLRGRVAQKFSGGQLALGLDGNRPEPLRALDVRAVEGLPALQGRVMEPSLLEEERHRFLEGLYARAAAGWQVHLFFGTQGTRDRFLELYGKDFRPTAAFHVHVGVLSGGFLSEALRFMAVAESDLYGRRKETRGWVGTVSRRRRTAQATGPRLAEWTDLQPGDLVVHVDHGIGKYLGLYEIEFNGRKQEVMAIEYADRAKLYVPVAQAHLLARYVGVGRNRPNLHALGGRKWMRDKVVAENAVRDLAASLLETQAARETLAGHAFKPDSSWQHEFEASFPYQETRDQERALQEMKQDMESPRPMDRLVCGDVGYGKTEVAMRAAFKTVMDGRQVAVLVPTTILAQQHVDTFSARMESFPVQVEMLSRFQTRGQQQDIVERVRAGQVDIVIGTHRLIQPDVGFKNLGLVIIDEEQRFGVEQKESLKQLRQTVDVLTLTATPIPRTLYMSLTGARDMSTIQTPPQERLPIETIVAQDSDQVIRDAILHELNRDGQVFYLHNRVNSIGRVRQRLERLVPECRVGLAHGQMPENELATIMRAFVKGDLDVLLCTTIIESGVDIPNVNTILIDRADRFGMADLYQLRGRVGRYKHKAYAYLLLPKHGRLFDTARQRIAAIRRYSSLGAGFKLALRDLEIRGAGNLLGAAQSGHIAAVGFDLYCQLLKRSIARQKGEPVPPIIEVEVKLDFIDLATGAAHDGAAAVLPVEYIEDENLRVHAYRKIASATSEADIRDLQNEFRDRFGPLPAPVERLLGIALLRIACALKNIRSVEVREDKVMLMRGQDYITHRGRFPRLQSQTPSDRIREMTNLVQGLPGP